MQFLYRVRVVVMVVAVVVVVMDRRHLAGIMVVVVEMGRRHLAGIMVFVVHIFCFFICICRRDAGAPLIFVLQKYELFPTWECHHCW